MLQNSNRIDSTFAIMLLWIFLWCSKISMRPITSSTNNFYNHNYNCSSRTISMSNWWKSRFEIKMVLGKKFLEFTWTSFRIDDHLWDSFWRLKKKFAHAHQNRHLQRRFLSPHVLFTESLDSSRFLLDTKMFWCEQNENLMRLKNGSFISEVFRFLS